MGPFGGSGPYWCHGASEPSAAGVLAAGATWCCSPSPQGPVYLPAGVQQVAGPLPVPSPVPGDAGGPGGGLTSSCFYS